MSLNVHGLNTPKKIVIAKFKNEKPYAIFLQETHLSQTEHEKKLVSGIQNTVYINKDAGRGVIILKFN